jgi:preprotein translocase subunit SecG
MSINEFILVIIALLLIVLIVLVILQRGAIVNRLSGTMGEQLEVKHRAMIGDVGNKFDQMTECH